MRTTITLEDDAFKAANAYARAHAVTLGTAISELIRRSSEARIPLKKVKGVWVLDLPPNARRVTTRQVTQLLDESA